jgi:hypothetical protein
MLNTRRYKMEKYLLCITIVFMSFHHGNSASHNWYCDENYDIGVIEDISENTSIVLIKFKYISDKSSCKSGSTGPIKCILNPTTIYKLDLTKDDIYSAFIPILWTAYENYFHIAFQSYDDPSDGGITKIISDIALDNNLNSEVFSGYWESGCSPTD